MAISSLTLSITVDASFGEIDHQKRLTLCRLLDDIKRAIGDGRPLSGAQDVVLPGAGAQAHAVVGSFTVA